MKKDIILIAAATMLLVSCRKEADYMPYIGESSHLAYSNYTEQFQYIWKNISTSYVFWDVDTVDWDAAYDRFLPRFEALDRKYQDSGYVRTAELRTLYVALMGNLLDHHMRITIRNMHPAPTDTKDTLYFDNGRMEIPTRDYYIESHADEQAAILAFLPTLASHYSISGYATATVPIPEFGGTTVTYHSCIINLPDGRKIPYLWQSMAAITPVMRDMAGTPAYALLDGFFSAIRDLPRSQLAGIILDNRTNRGGYQDDLDYLIGSFINEKTEIERMRYKEGPGRLEYSVWCPYYIYPQSTYRRDLTAEDIPYVVICDINSISMGEVEPMMIKATLPTAHIVGERTYGATGALQTNSEDLNYSAPFGNAESGYHYIYSASFEPLIGGKIMEGIGLTPDEEVLRKDDPSHSFKPQLDAAVSYIQNYPY